MSIQSKKEEQHNFDFSRDLMRAAFRSLLWSVYSFKRKHEGMTLKKIADDLETDKSVISKWFSGDPNWRLNTIADLSEALDIDIKIIAVDRKSHCRFGPAGEIKYTLSQITGHPQIMTAASKIVVNIPRSMYANKNEIHDVR